jgi:hypothetical protein
MALWILRAVFLVVAAGVGVTLTTETSFAAAPWFVFPAVMAGAGIILAIDILVPRKRIELISSVYFGVVVALFLTYVLGLAFAPLYELSGPSNRSYVDIARLLLGVALCYVCISMLMQTKDDFRFIIPYVELSKA